MVTLTKKEIADGLKRLGFNNPSEVLSNTRGYRQYYIRQNFLKNEFSKKNFLKRLEFYSNLKNIFDYFCFSKYIFRMLVMIIPLLF